MSNDALIKATPQEQPLELMLKNDLLINDAWAFYLDEGREDSARRLVLALAQRIEELDSQEQPRRFTDAEKLAFMIAYTEIERRTEYMDESDYQTSEFPKVLSTLIRLRNEAESAPEVSESSTGWLAVPGGVLK